MVVCGPAGRLGEASIALAVLASLAAGPVAPPATLPDDLPQDVVADDNTRITRSCRLILPPRPLVDADGNGVIQIVADDIVVDLQGATLMGAPAGTPQNSLGGIGIAITGKRVTLRNGVVTGYKVGLAGRGCHGSTVEGFSFARNFAQALQSTPNEESAADWLWPHANDEGEWERNYGAAISMSDAHGLTIRNCGVRMGQNGILLSRVTASRIYACDASFLSGWGIALWRSCGNTIAGNALDFCIRGYSHDVYNRGQDSAGILCFEQSSDNVFVLNSATHCGDGFFSFAGREALGEVAPPQAAPREGERHLYQPGQGCNRNLIAFNDFSDAAAHGIETTFSSGVRIFANRCDRDAICGIWGGYSRGLVVAGNMIRACGTRGSRGEGGGVNIEHGIGCVITGNQFSANSIGVSLWWDEDGELAKTPWAGANGVGSSGNCVVGNRFDRDEIALMLRQTTGTTWCGNELLAVPIAIEADASSSASITTSGACPVDAVPLAPSMSALGLTAVSPAVNMDEGIPITCRKELSGRAAIVMGEFGPYDFVAPMVTRLPGPTNIHQWKLLGAKQIKGTQVRQGTADIRTNIDTANNVAIVETETLGHLSNYTLEVYWGRAPGESQAVSGTIWNTNWRVSLFAIPQCGNTPPSREQFDEAASSGHVVYVENLQLPFGMGGPDAARLIGPAEVAGRFGSDYFGLRATTEFDIAPGEWVVEVRSDDGVRVALDGKVILDEWTHHGPTTYRVPLSVTQMRVSQMSVDYFELAGFAQLDVRIIPAGTAPIGDLDSGSRPADHAP